MGRLSGCPFPVNGRKGKKMTILKIGEKEYKIQFGYKATADSGIIKDLMKLDDRKSDMEAVDAIIGLLPKMLLVGLQKNHKEEFSCDLKNISGSDAEEKACDLLDDYFDSDYSDANGIFQILQGELVENGFLSKLLNQQNKKK